MNDKFERFLIKSGWERRSIQRAERNHYNQLYPPEIDYVKCYKVNLNNTEFDVPVAARFYNLDTREIPTKASISFVHNPIITPGRENRGTSIKGAYRIISSLEVLGYITAVKFVVFGNKSNYFDRLGKEILSKFSDI